ncbi:MAG: hypothetical protein Q8Q06_02710 [bacterium]|nr:hypothetical protein [bacterium]
MSEKQKSNHAKNDRGSHDSSPGPVFEFEPGWGKKLNKWLRTNGIAKLLPVIAVIVLLAGVFSVLQNRNNDKLSLDLDKISDSQEAIIQIAQPRDGYSVLARRALTEYMAVISESLTPGQKLFIEETLREIVEKDTLEIGQEVKFLKADISSAISNSKNLTASQLQRWEAWAETVNFNQ